MLITAKPEASMALTMTSHEIAELTGKDHKNVIRDIRLMLDELTGDGSDLSHALEDKDVCGCRPAHHAFVRTGFRRLAPGRNAGGQRAEGTQKKAARCNNTLAAIKKINIHNKMNATNSIANRARPESAKAAFGEKPCVAISLAPLSAAQPQSKDGVSAVSAVSAVQVPIHAGFSRYGTDAADVSAVSAPLRAKGFKRCKRRTTKAQFGNNAAKFLGRPGYPAPKCCAKVFASPELLGLVLKNIVSEHGAYTHALSWVFSRQKFADMGFPMSHGFGRDGLVRKAGRMACSMFLTSRPPDARKNANGGFQSRHGAETMTTVNTTPTPKMGNLGTTPATSPSTIARQQAIENALTTALYFIRLPHTESGLKAATGRAIRATSLLKQACSEANANGRA